MFQTQTKGNEMNLPAKNSDPVTSHEAARAIIATGDRAYQQHLAYSAVRAYPGRTSLELSALSGQDRYRLARRLPELIDRGLVTQGPKRRCTASPRGLNAVTWEPVPVQLQLVD